MYFPSIFAATIFVSKDGLESSTDVGAVDVEVDGEDIELESDGETVVGTPWLLSAPANMLNSMMNSLDHWQHDTKGEI